MRCVTVITASTLAALFITLCPNVALGQGHVIVEQDVIYGEAGGSALMADVAYPVLEDGITVTPRFLETEDPIKIIDTFSETITKTKEVSKVDSIVSIRYSFSLP